MLNDIFFSLISRYSNDSALQERLWQEIERSYSGRKRKYHNLSHLQFLYDQLSPCRPYIQDWDAVVFAIFYHDIIYKVSSHTNEQQSADLAKDRLGKAGCSAAVADRCYIHILATAGHQLSSDPDTNLFTDADLAILGQEKTVYESYCRQIRKEYSLYPDILYKPGRKKVILHFLAMDRIFKTSVFYNQLEQQARENLSWELEHL